MFTEYVLYMVEALQSRERRNDLLKALNGQETNGQQDGGHSLWTCQSVAAIIMTSCELSSDPVSLNANIDEFVTFHTPPSFFSQPYTIHR